MIDHALHQSPADLRILDTWVDGDRTDARDGLPFPEKVATYDSTRFFGGDAIDVWTFDQHSDQSRRCLDRREVRWKIVSARYRAERLVADASEFRHVFRTGASKIDFDLDRKSTRLNSS